MARRPARSAGPAGSRGQRKTTRCLSGYCNLLLRSQRARHTAETIRQTVRAEVITTDELRPWNLGIFCGQLLQEIIPFLNMLNEHPDMRAPNGESFHQFYERYSRRLKQILHAADESAGYVVAVTHVRNLLAARTILTNGERDRVPVQGGPSTGTLTFVEKIAGVWTMYTEEKRTHALMTLTSDTEVSDVTSAN